MGGSVISFPCGSFLCGFVICRSAGLVPHYANLVNTNAVRSVRRGGNLNNGTNAGPCYMNANNAPSNANWNYGGAHPPHQSGCKRL